MPGQKARRLFRRLREELGIDVPEDAFIRRTYAGRNQKSAGAFVWFLESRSNVIWPPMGSSWPVTDLLKCSKLIVEGEGGITADREILPDITWEEVKQKFPM